MTEQGRTELAENQPDNLGTRSVVDVNAEAEQPQATEDAQVAHPESIVGHDIDDAPAVQDVTQAAQDEAVAPHKETTEQAEGPTAEASFVPAHKETTEEAEGPTEAVADVAEAATNAVAEAAPSFLERVTGAAAALAERVSEAVAPVTEKVSETVTFVAEKVTDAKDAVSEAATDAQEAVSDAVAPVAAVATDAQDAVAEVAADAKEAVSDAVAPVAELATDAQEAVSDAVAPVAAVATDAKDAVAEAATDMQEAVSDAVAPVAEAAADVTAEAKDVVSDAAAPVAEAASDVTGIVPAAEASYDPDQAEDGRPRRVKDLSAGMELEGRVTSIALYGVFVDIGVGRDGLVHISEMSETRIDSPSDVVKIGDTITVRVKSVDPDGRRISLTMRNKERSSEPRHRPRKKSEINREALAALRVGDNISGNITGVSNFGVFVDIGVGKDGLVHVSELAEGRVEKPEDVVAVGETHTFKILEVDADGARISLSLRRAQRTQRLQQLEKGQIVEGTISGIAPFGAFIDIGVGRDGLVHISELSDGRVNKVEDAVKVGDKVMVRVLDVDPQNKRISLTLRLEDKPREVAPREERSARPAREDRGPRPPRPDRSSAPREPEVYTAGAEADEPFTGDATIEDLLSKYGSNKRDRRRRDDDEEEDSEDRGSRRQRDAIRRTLQHMDDE